METGPNDRRRSAYHIRRACEAGLRRLKTNHIDLYQMHHVDRSTPWEEIWQAMEQLIREGKITYIGSSNFAGWDIATAQCTAVWRKCGDVRAGPRAGVQKERHPHWSGAAAGAGARSACAPQRGHRPGTDDIYIVTNDAAGGEGAAIFHARAFAKALPLYSHR
jgi:hypothetical protein